MRHRPVLAAVAAGCLTAGLTLTAGPAFAGGTPSVCPTPTSLTGVPNSGTSDANAGGDCAIQGTISITSAISIATNITSFNLASTALNTPSGAGQIVIASNQPAGYWVSIAGPAGGFTDGHGHVLPDANVDFWQQGSGPGVSGGTCPATSSWGFSPLTDPGAVTNPLSEQVIKVNQPSGQMNCAQGFQGYSVPAGQDSFDLAGFELTSSNGAVTGSYTGTVQMAAWGS